MNNYIHIIIATLLCPARLLLGTSMSNDIHKHLRISRRGAAGSCHRVWIMIIIIL